MDTRRSLSLDHRPMTRQQVSSPHPWLLLAEEAAAVVAGEVGVEVGAGAVVAGEVGAVDVAAEEEPLGQLEGE